MNYALTFLEGLMTFISPCLLPMLPVYVTFFAGLKAANDRVRTAVSALMFIAGFTAVFVLLGAFAGTLGAMLHRHYRTIDVIFGVILIIFGLNYSELLNIPLLNNMQRGRLFSGEGWFAPLLFGGVFALGYTPCIGAFLGAALMQAASAGGALPGVALLFCYSMGLGLPFFVCALFIDRLKGALRFINQNHHVIRMISGALLMAMGCATIMGWMRIFYGIFS